MGAVDSQLRSTLSKAPLASKEKFHEIPRQKNYYTLVQHKNSSRGVARVPDYNRGVKYS